MWRKNRPVAVVAAAVATTLFRFQDPAIEEASGIAPAAGAVIWVHNDSGDEPVLYAIDAAGRTEATLHLAGARARDWEDMAAAGGFLYVGDIGDNRRSHESVALYRVAEPEDPRGAMERRAQAMTLTYPDGAHDAEALLVHPSTGEIGVVTKSERAGGGALYVASAFATGRHELRRAAAVPVELVTGAAVAPDGRHVVVRNYTGAYMFDLAGTSLESAFEASPDAIEVPFAFQAEAITFSADSRSVITTSEGAGATVHAIALDPDVDPSTPASTVPPEQAVEGPTRPGRPAVAALGALVAIAVALVVVLRRRR